MRVEGLGEVGLLGRIKPYLSAHAGLADAAVLEDAAGFVAASCAMFAEGVHFHPEWLPAEDAGWRSLALAVGSRLNEAGLCCGDSSDGLLREMDKFVAFSGCGCVIRADEVPVAGGATLEEALTSGEEAALVCAGPEALVLQAGLRPFGFLT